MQKEDVTPIKKWIQKSLWLSALWAFLTSPLAYGAGDFSNKSVSEVNKAFIAPNPQPQRAFATEFGASAWPQGLQEFRHTMSLTPSTPDISATRTFHFSAFAPIKVNTLTLDINNLWNPQSLAALFSTSKVHITQSYANGIDGRISTPTNLKWIGPSSLDCDLSLRMAIEPEVLDQLNEVEGVKQIIKARGRPSLAFVVETKNCNMVFKWTYQLALLYPTASGDSQLLIAGRMYIKNESLQKLKIALVFSNPKKFFDQRLAQELKTFANALEATYADRQP